MYSLARGSPAVDMHAYENNFRSDGFSGRKRPPSRKVCHQSLVSFDPSFVSQIASVEVRV